MFDFGSMHNMDFLLTNGLMFGCEILKVDDKIISIASHYCVFVLKSGIAGNNTDFFQLSRNDLQRAGDKVPIYFCLF